MTPAKRGKGARPAGLEAEQAKTAAQRRAAMTRRGAPDHRLHRRPRGMQVVHAPYSSRGLAAVGIRAAACWHRWPFRVPVAWAPCPSRGVASEHRRRWGGGHQPVSGGVRAALSRTVIDGLFEPDDQGQARFRKEALPADGAELVQAPVLRWFVRRGWLTPATGTRWRSGRTQGACHGAYPYAPPCGWPGPGHRPRPAPSRPPRTYFPSSPRWR